MTRTFADAFGAYVDAALDAASAFDEQLRQEQVAFAARFDAAFADQRSINVHEIYALGVPCIDCLELVTDTTDRHEINCTFPAGHGPGDLSKGFYARCGQRWIP